MNSVNIIGRIGKPAEIKYTSNNNKAVANLSLAVDDGWGENKKTYWIPCVAWEKKAETFAKMEKGQQVGISGKITTRDWADNEGKKHYVTEVLVEEITFCGSKPTASVSPAGNEQPSGWQPVEDDDELPF